MGKYSHTTMRCMSCLVILSLLVGCAAPPMVIPVTGSQGSQTHDEGGALFSTAEGGAPLPPDLPVIRNRYVNIDTSLLLSAASPITLNLFDGTNYRAYPDRLEATSDGATWAGHLEGVDFSNVIFMINYDRGVTGSISFPGGLYEVHPSGDAHVLYQVDQAALPADAPPGDTEPSPEGVVDAMGGSDPANIIDVVVVYTDAAKAAAATAEGKPVSDAGPIDRKVNLMFEETNTSFQNSNVLVPDAGSNNVVLRVRQVYKGLVSYTESGTKTGQMLTDLYRLRNTSDGYMDSVHTIRNDNGGDIVILVVSNGVGYCSQAYGIMDMVSSSFADKAFAVVDLDCATGNFSFAYVIGNIMGARSDWDTDSTNNAPFTYNHGYVNTSGRWRTIMGLDSICAQSGYSCERVQYWSNPEVTYTDTTAPINSGPMGIAEGSARASDNRKTLQNTASTVANFRTTVAKLPDNTSLNSPVDNAVFTGSSPISFNWNQVDTASHYLFKIQRNGVEQYNSGWKTTAELCSGSTCSVQVPSLESGSDYSVNWTWSVQVKNEYGTGGTQTRNMRVVPLPGSVVLQSPAEAGNTPFTQPIYSWSQVTGGITTYYLTVSRGGTTVISSRAFTDSVCSGGVCSVQPVDVTLLGGAHTWSIRSENLSGTGPTSTGSFTVVAPNPPTPVSPDGSASQLQPAYNWTRSGSAPNYDGAVEYVLVVDGPSGNLVNSRLTAATVCSGTSCSYTPSVTLTGGSHSWKVLGSNAAGDGVYSAVKTFSASVPISTSSLSSPADLAVFYTNPQTFVWSAVTGATGYDLDISTQLTGSAGPYTDVSATTTSYAISGGGTYYWRVRAKNLSGAGPWSGIRSFTASGPAAPALSSPADGVTFTGNSQNFSWGSVVNATSYELKLVPPSATPVTYTYAGTSTSPAVTLSETGTYTWQVRSNGSFGPGSWSPARSFTTTSPAAPVLSSPADGVTFTSNVQTFTWGSVTDATSYELKLVPPSTTPATYTYTGTTTSPAVTLSETGSYTWQVRSISSFGAGPWSTARSFTTAGPAAPVLSSPANGTTFTTNPQTFSWGSVTDATSYELKLVAPSTTPVTYTYSGTSSSPAVTLSETGTYTWQVRSIGIFGPGSWSTARSFTTGGPAAPVLSSPADGVTFTTNPQTFSWGSVTDATSYELKLVAPSTTPVTYTYSGTSSSPAVTLSETGIYTWQVRSIGTFGPGSWSTARNFTTSALVAPVLSSPANGVTFTTNPQTFSWGSVTDATSYELKLVPPSATPLTYTYSGTSSSPAVTLSETGSYTWQVRSINSFGPGAWSSSRSFTTSTLAAPAFNGSSFADASVFYTTPQVFQWAAVTDATGYKLEITLSGSTTTYTTAIPSYSVDLTSVGSYTWRVRSVGAFGDSPAGSSRSFTVLAPVAPTLSAPSSGSTIYTNSVSFSWSSVPTAVGGYELEITKPGPVVVSQDVSGTSQTVVFTADASSLGAYSWRVRAKSSAFGVPGTWSSAATFTLAVPVAPTSLTPASATTIYTNSQSLNWATVSGEVNGYELEITKSGGGTETIDVSSLPYTKTWPADATGPGTYTWRVRAKSSAFAQAGTWSSSNTIILVLPMAPSLTSPADNTTIYTNSQAFSWGAVTGAVNGYELELNKGGTIETIDVASVTSYTKTWPADATPLGAYTWRVRAKSSDFNQPGTWSGTRNLSLAVPPAPSLTTPADLTTIYTNSQAFTWGAVASAVNGYELELNKSGTIESIDVASGTTYTKTWPADATPLGSYTWRVRTKSSAFGQPGTWATARTITLAIPPAPSLTSPATNTTIYTNSQAFSWGAASGAVSGYELELNLSGTIETITIASGTTYTKTWPADATPLGAYTWRVRAKSSAFGQPGTWATARNLTLSVPPAPSLTSPATNTTIYTNSQAFSWGAASGAVSGYELELNLSGTIETITIASGTTYTKTWPADATPLGAYTWRVRAKSSAFGQPGTWATARNLTLAVPPAPVQSAPANSSSAYTNPVTFTWAAASGAVSGYQLEITKSGGGTETIDIASGVTYAKTFTPADATSAGSYTWRVRAKSSAFGQPGTWSGTWTLTLTGPVAPTPSQPSGTASSAAPDFTWSQVALASSYDVDIDGTTQTGVAATCTAGTCTVNLGVQSGGPHTWKVRSVGLFGAGAWSTTNNFSISAPAQVSVTSPADGTSTYTTSQTFTWGSVLGSTGYELELTLSGGGATSYNTASTSYAVAFTTPGVYTWRVRASNSVGAGSWSSPVRTITINAPATPGSLSPADNTTIYTNSQVISWGASTGATGYDLEVTLSGGGTNTYSTTAPTVSYTVPFISNGTYTWRVRASSAVGPGAWSTTRTLTVASPLAPGSLSPVDAASTYATSQLFSWASSTGATGYDLEVTLSGGSATTYNTASTNYTVTFSTAGVYTWRVRANNVLGNGSWSTPVRTITVNAPATPGPLSPADNTTIYTNSQLISWSASGSATGYDLEVSLSGGATNTYSTTAPTISYTVPFTSNGTYTWRLRGSNTLGNGAWSTARTLVVAAPLAPGLLAPADSTSTYATSQLFSWASSTGATGYDLEVTLSGGSATTYSTPSTSNTVAFTTPGVYTWRVRANNALGNGSWSTPVYTITINAPATPGSLSPADNTTIYTNSQVINWGASTGATGYDLEVSLSGGGTNTYSTTAPTMSYTVPFISNGTYTWRVRASSAVGPGSWSTTRILIVASPLAPGTLSPADNTSTYATSQLFSWASSTGATSYDLEVTLSGGSATSYNTASTNYTMAFTTAGSYTWRVRANNSLGNGDWSSPVRTITINAPATPDSLSPADNTILYTNSQLISWGDSTGATGYDLEVSLSGGGTNTYSTTAPTVSYSVPFTSYGTYTWRVRGNNAAGAGAWSSAYTLIVAGPEAPGSLSPVDNTTIYTTSQLFSWGPSSGATGYELELSLSGGGSTSYPTTAPTTSYSVSFTTPGEYTWRVRALNSLGSGSWNTPAYTFIVSAPPAPGSLSPANAVTISTNGLTFTWDSVASASAGYELELDPPTGSNTVTAYPGTSTGSLNFAGFPGIYSWRVRGVHSVLGGGAWSNWSTFATTGPAAPAYTGDSPADGAIFYTGPQTFTWAAVINASGYKLEVTCEGQSPVVYSTTGVSSTSSPATFDGVGNYTWRVLSTGDFGDGDWSAVRSFTVAAPDAPVPSSPEDGASLRSTRPTLQWVGVSGQGTPSYHLIVEKEVSGDWTGVYDSGWVSGNSHTLATDLVGSGSYRWKVQTRNTSLMTGGDWSEPFGFALLTPAQVTQQVPEDNSITYSALPQFQWAAADGAVQYRLVVTGINGTSYSYTSDALEATSHTLPETHALLAGDYQWKVQSLSQAGSTDSATWQFMVAIPPAASAQTPSTTNKAYSPTPQFTWSKVSQATQYRISVDKWNSGTSAWVSQYTTSWNTPVCGESTCNITPATTLSIGEYRWKVQTSSPAGVGPESEWQPFPVSMPPAIQAGDLIAPEEGYEEYVDWYPEFSWKAISGSAASYVLAVHDSRSDLSDPEDGNLFLQFTVSTDNCTDNGDGTWTCRYRASGYTNALTYGPCIWKVKAVNGLGETGWSNEINFQMKVSGAPPEPGNTLARPAAPKLLSPGLTTPLQTPPMKWVYSPTELVFKYRLVVKGINIDKTKLVYEQVIPAEQVTCSDITFTCSMVSPVSLTGSYTWWLSAYNEQTPGGIVQESPQGIGRVTLIAPQAPVMGDSPTISNADFIPVYHWLPVVGATGYHVEVYLTGKQPAKVISQDLSDSVCNGETCEFKPGIQLLAGNTYIWRLSAKNSAGLSPVATGNFTVANLVQPVLISPEGNIENNQPNLIWQPVNGAVTYNLVINTTAGTPIMKKTYSASSACPLSDINCSVQVPVVLGGNSYVWMVQAVNKNLSPWSGEMAFRTQPGTPQVEVGGDDYPYNPRPKYSWNAVEGASEYIVKVWLKSASWASMTSAGGTYTAEAVCNGDGDNDPHTCNVLSAISLRNGNYRISIQAKKGLVYGVASNLVEYEVQSPSAPQLITPIGNIESTRPAYQWVPSIQATVYEINVYKSSGGLKFAGKVKAADFCNTQSNICTLPGNHSMTQELSSSEDNYSWSIRAISAAGPGITSQNSYFSVTSTGVPPAGMSPSGGLTSIDSLQWQAMQGMSYYRLILYGPSASGGGTTVAVIKTKYAASKICAGGVCRVPVALKISGEYNWKVQGFNGVYQPWSEPVHFSLKPDVPGVVTISGHELPYDPYPAISWGAANGAQKYNLTVNMLGLDGRWTKFSSLTKTVSSDEACNADGDGNPLTCKVIPPKALMNGSYRVWVQSVVDPYTSLPTATVYFSISVPPTPTLISPVNSDNHANFQPVYSWNSVANAQYYLLTIQTDSLIPISIANLKLEASTYCHDGITCSLPASDRLNPMLTQLKGYAWSVKAVAASGATSSSNRNKFTVQPLDPTSLLSPENGAGLVDSAPWFTWGKVGGATKYKLVLSISQGKTIIEKTYTSDQLGCGPVGSDTCQAMSPVILLGDSYTWKVLPFNGSFLLTDPEVWLFTVEPGVPEDISPNGKIFITHPTLSWKESEGATGYLVTMKWMNGIWINMSGSPFNVTPASCVDGQCTKDLGTLNSGDYSITIQAVNSVSGIKSRPITVLFTVSPPNVPLLLTPTSGDTGIGNPPRFVWYAVNQGSLYQLIITGTKTRTVVNLGTADACDSESTPVVCEYIPDQKLTTGDYKWKVRALGEAGYSLWSSEPKFTIP